MATKTKKAAIEEQLITIEVDFDKHFKTFGDLQDYNNSARTADFDTQLEVMRKCIVSWTLDGDPSEVESYRALHPSEWYAVQGLFNSQLGAYFRK